MVMVPQKGRKEIAGPDPLVGAHMSIAGGIHRAFDHGERTGCRTLQIFLKNNTQWNAKALVESDRSLYVEAQRRTGINPVVAHGTYLINLASPDPALYRKSLQAFIKELERANYLGVAAVIIHPGSHMGTGTDAGIRRVVMALEESIRNVPPPVRILLENTAGQGNSLGSRFEELEEILEGMKGDGRVGVCMDTCHAFAAGYDLRTEAAYRKTMREFDRRIGLDKIAVIHANDCRRELGSRVDRHTHIGEGRIGLEGFRCLMNDRRFARVPKILETPKGPDLLEDLKNLATLRSLVRAGRPSAR